MVGNSRVLSMVENPWLLGGQGFMPGLAALLAPVWLFTDSPVVVYQAGIWLCVGVALVAIWPMSHVFRWAGTTPAAATTVAAVVSVAPARALLSNYMLSEALFLLATAALIAAAIRLYRQPSNGSAVLLGLSVGAVCFAHGRGVATAIAVALALALAVVRRALALRLGALAVGVGVMTSFIAYGVFRRVAAATLALDGRVDALTERPVASVADGIAGAIGQVWYMTLAWPAVALAGVAFVVWRVRRDHIAVLVLLVGAASFAMGVWQSSPAWGPAYPDVWYYGRYMDTVWTLMAGVGIVVLLRVRRRSLGIVVVAVTAVVGAVMAAYVGPRVPVEGLWREMHVLGVAPWLSRASWENGEPQQWWLLALLGTVLAAAVAVIAWLRRPVVLVAGLAVFWGGLSVAYDHIGIDPADGGRTVPGALFGLDAIPEDVVIGVDARQDLMWNVAQFASPERDASFWDPFYRGRPTDVYLASWEDPRYAERGALLVEGSARGATALVVFPGELQDQLRQQGHLEPIP
ncbi:hypothetical protein [uncultured Demequina sp.]|uniref:hypothetical protein n=1 Tax=uncultured Demequina sp. TaxID=693499 RepID=UPI0025D2A9DE|nr:hypothetical protein [uncultured Demequina sp.]